MTAVVGHTFAMKPQVGTYTQPARTAMSESFWSNVNFLGSCWEWTGLTTDWGYGRLRSYGHDFLAHRCVYELFYGQLPRNKWVLHKCDNPPCVRPDHLFMGDPVDNTQDMIAKGRHSRIGPRGEENRHARLTAEQVVAMREEFARGATTPSELADKYGISTSNVNQIIRGATWAHTGGPICARDRRGEHRRRVA